jgi:hypothetical protein
LGNAGNIGGTTIDNNNTISITLPNVKNYDEFMNAARSDPKFEKLVKAMTVDRLSGRSGKEKYGIKW